MLDKLILTSENFSQILDNSDFPLQYWIIKYEIL